MQDQHDPTDGFDPNATADRLDLRGIGLRPNRFACMHARPPAPGVGIIWSGSGERTHTHAAAGAFSSELCTGLDRPVSSSFAEPPAAVGCGVA